VISTCVAVDLIHTGREYVNHRSGEVFELEAMDSANLMPQARIRMIDQTLFLLRVRFIIITL